MSKLVPFEITEKCDNCGKTGAFDFMGDLYCPDCLKSCENCDGVFVIDLNIPRDEQRYCLDCL